jgi:WD40 repeat protein
LMNGINPGFRFTILAFVIFFAVALGSCAPEQIETPSPTSDTPTTAPSPSPSQTSTATFAPTLTPDYSPTPGSVNPYLGPVPEGALARLGKGRANAVAFSPDGQELAVASGLGVFVYRADTLEAVWSVSMEGWTAFPAYSPDGTRLAVVVEGYKLYVLDAHSGGQLASWEIPPVDDAYTALCAIAFSPDGALLAGQTPEKLLLWNSADGKLQPAPSPSGSSYPCGLDFSPDGKTLAAARGDHVILWNMQDNKKIMEMQTAASLRMGSGPENKLIGVKFLPDGKMLVTNDGSVWNSVSGKVVRTLEDFNGTLAALSPDGGQAADESGVWQVDTGKQLWSYPPAYMNDADALSFSPDGKMLAAASDNGVVLLDAATGQYRESLDIHFKAERVAFSADGASLIGWNGKGRYRVWDARSLWLSETFSAEPCGVDCTQITSAGVDIYLSAPVNKEGVASPDGKLHILFGGYYEPLVLRDAEKDDQAVAALPAGPGAAFSPDGKLLATTDISGSILLWNVAALEGGAMPPPSESPTPTPNATITPTSAATSTPLPKQSMNLEAGAVLALAYSTDGAGLTVVTADGVSLLRNGEISEKWSWPGYLDPNSVAVSPDGATVAAGPELSLWNVATAQQVRTLMLSGEEVFGRMPAFSADGQLLAAVTADGIGVWKTATGSLVRTLGDASLSDIFFDDLAFSPDGKILAAAAGTQLYLWDMETGSLPEPESFNCRGDTTYDQIFSSDGKSLVIACGPSDYPLGFLSFWDVPGGELHDYWDETSAIRRLAYSPDGKLLAMGFYNGHIRLWGPAIDVDLAGHGEPLEGIPFGPSGEVLGIEHEVTALAYSPDGQILASGSLDGSLILTQVSSLTVATTAGGSNYASTTAPSGCALAPGYIVHARENARLWSVPDVSQAVIVGQPPADQALLVLSGSREGWIRADQSESGWFWEVSIYSASENPGWIWQSRIKECP